MTDECMFPRSNLVKETEDKALRADGNRPS
jgi:hypothetical protein